MLALLERLRLGTELSVRKYFAATVVTITGMRQL